MGTNKKHCSLELEGRHCITKKRDRKQTYVFYEYTGKNTKKTVLHTETSSRQNIADNC